MLSCNTGCIVSHILRDHLFFWTKGRVGSEPVKVVVMHWTGHWCTGWHVGREG